MSVDTDIARLEKQLEELRAQRRAEMQAKMDAVTPLFTFTLTPVTDHWRESADPACRWYELRGTIQNKDECLAVGKKPLDGAMRYLYNTLSGRFVVSNGGGTVWLKLGHEFGGEPDVEAWTELEAFVKDYPEGGDVTPIVDRYRKHL